MLTAASLALVGLSPAVAAPHLTTAKLVATAAGGNAPLDAIPDPTGRTIYFTTNGPAGPGVFAVPADGGAVRTVLAGRPLTDPVGLTLSRDGSRLFVADAGTARTLDVRVDRAGVSVLRGSVATDPHGLEVAPGASRRVVFTGKDPSNGKPGVFALPEHGATRPTVVAEGGRMERPRGRSLPVWRST
jgi:DNA-binding beta-propeller fold protein YncE